MTDTHSSGQAAADQNEQKQYNVRQPGLWLDEPMTAQEIQEACTLFGIAKSMGVRPDPDELIQRISPYMDSLMHLIYLVSKDKMHLQAVEGDIKVTDNGFYFDILKYTVDFVINAAGLDNGFKAFIGTALKEIIHDETKAEQGGKKAYTDFIINESSINKRMMLLEFAMDMLKDPEEALLNWTDLQSGNYEAWFRSYHERLAKGVAMQFGVDAEQVLNPETRTPEQDRAMTELAGALTLQRLEKYNSSSYMQAVKALLQEESKSYSNAANEEEIYKIKKAAILYFFAQHPEKTPEATASLTDEHITELKDTYHSLEAYFLQETDGKQVDDMTRERILFDFVEQQDSKTPEQKKEIITNLRQDIITKKLREIAYPVDKVNSKLWGLTIGEKAELKAERDSDSKKGKQANIYVLIDFEEMKSTGITISRPLTSYDKRIFIAAANLKDQGHDTVTTAQIYAAMGNRGKPNSKQREKILKSLEVMSLCRVTLDNTEEAKLYTKYDKVKRTFYLLPTTIDKGYVNGLIVDDAINIMELPKLYEFAKGRGQFATTPLKLLETPLSQTEDNLSLEDYLLTRILRMKKAKEKHKEKVITTIALDTVYDNCNINDKIKRSRAKEKIERLLQHYQKDRDLIKGYKLTPKSIEINL